MAQTLWIATRKGLFAATRAADGRWTIATPPHFLGEPVTMLLDDPRDGAVYASLNIGHFGVKLHRSDDRGATWREIAAPSYAFTASAPASAPASATGTASAAATPSAGAANGEKDAGDRDSSASTHPDADAAADASKAPSLYLLWALEAGGPDEPGALWAGTIPGALFRSTDRGETWEPNRPLWDRPERQNWFGGGYDQPGIHSICVDPRDSSRVTVAVSCGGVWHTADRGASWTSRCKGMWAAYMPEDQKDNPDIQDPHRLVSCPAAPDHLWVQHHNGVFVSENGGGEWRDLPDAKPSTFGFAVAVHPQDPRTAWFAPAVKDERRVPVDARFVISRTRDGGQSFEVLASGLPAPSYDLVYRHGLDVDRTGRTLAVGSTTGGLWISEDEGDRWQTLSANLPPIYAVRFGGEA